MSADYNKKIFAKNLLAVLADADESQRDLAKIIGVSSSTVSSWCTGQKIPRMDKVEKIAKHFGVLKSDLIEEKYVVDRQDFVHGLHLIFRSIGYDLHIDDPEHKPFILTPDGDACMVDWKVIEDIGNEVRAYVGYTIERAIKEHSIKDE